MNILLTNLSLAKPGGSETFTYAMAQELISRGHNVEVFCRAKGFMLGKMKTNLGVNFMSKNKYDLILANHRGCIDAVHGKGFMIQTCHGYIPKPEQPDSRADYHVGISPEVVSHLERLGFKSYLIYNGINCVRFDDKRPTNKKLTNVLSLVQNDITNERLRKICESKGINFEGFNKKTNFVWDVERKINDADLVISLGRGAYEAFACGRQVLIYDNRSYLKSFGDGMATSDNINELIMNNCSGRRYKNTYEDADIINEFEKYSKVEGKYLREFALKNFNIKFQVDKYLNIFNTQKHGK